MNKYQRVMEHVKVDDEMKKRILQNVEKELNSGEDKARDQVVKTSKVVPFRQRFGDGIKKYGAMVAMLAILLVGTVAVIRITGGVSNTSAPSMSDSAMEAPAAAPAEEAAEVEMAEPATNEDMAESPVYDSEATAEPAVEEPAEPSQHVGSAKTEGELSETPEIEQPSAAHYIGPIILLILVFAVIAFIIWLIIYLIRKYKNRK